MPRPLRIAVRAIAVLVMVAAILAVGFIPVFFAGFAWGLIAIVVVGVIIGRTTRGGIDGAYASFMCLVLLAIGFVAGLISRGAHAWFG